jgi:flagellar biosynthesis/type III secretory pathway ATPase
MENPFNLSDEKLKILLDGYFSWSKENENEEKYPELEKQKSEERRNLKNRSPKREEKLCLTKNIFQVYPINN